MLEIGRRLAVFSIRKTKTGTVWIRAGNAFVNRDGSLNVWLDVLPLDGALHVREAAEKKEAAPASAEMVKQAAEAAEKREAGSAEVVNPAAEAANSMGGH